MNSSWLVQRLRPPRSHPSVFSFGGGLRNGGLSDEAMDLLRGVFDFDYMGAAEFEFGAVPKALKEIAVTAEAGDLKDDAFEIDLKDVEKSWRKDAVHPTGLVTIFVLCPSLDVAEVEERIRGWAAGQGQLRELTMLPQRLRGDDYANAVGWLELDNGFFFFTDEDMWTKTCELFGVST
jgi:hypothetical protein